MSHIVDSCPLIKLAGGLSKPHSADDDAVVWLTNYGGPSRMHTTTTTSARRKPKGGIGKPCSTGKWL